MRWRDRDEIRSRLRGLRRSSRIRHRARRFPTSAARAALPPEVPMGETVASIGNASYVVLGLERGDLELLSRGLVDVLHQPRRAHLYPNRQRSLRTHVGLAQSAQRSWGRADRPDLDHVGRHRQGHGCRRSHLGDGWVLQRVPFSPHGLRRRSLRITQFAGDLWHLVPQNGHKLRLFRAIEGVYVGTQFPCDSVNSAFARQADHSFAMPIFPPRTRALSK